MGRRSFNALKMVHKTPVKHQYSRYAQMLLYACWCCCLMIHLLTLCFFVFFRFTTSTLQLPFSWWVGQVQFSRIIFARDCWRSGVLAFKYEEKLYKREIVETNCLGLSNTEKLQDSGEMDTFRIFQLIAVTQTKQTAYTYFDCILEIKGTILNNIYWGDIWLTLNLQLLC